MPMPKGHKHSDRTKEKMSIAQKKRYANMTEEENKLRAMRIKEKWRKINEAVNFLNQN